MSTVSLTREARKAQTREAIVVAAAKLFAKDGIEATSLDRIAAEVGLTKGAIYSTFASKDELVEAVAIASSVVVEPDVLFRDDVSLHEGLRLLAADLMAARKRVTHELVMLDLEIFLYERRHASRGKRVLAEQREGVAKVGEQLEAAAKARGERLPMPGAELLIALMSLARGIVQSLERDPKSLSHDSVLTLFEALANRPEGGSA